MATFIGVVTILAARGLDSLDSIAWDATLSETHTRENDITDHQVEDGGNVSDHIRAKPRRLTIDAVISDTPTSTGVLDPGRAKLLVERLDKLADGQTFTVTTGLRDYDSMAIEALEVPRASGSGKALRVVLRLKQIRIVRTKVISLKSTAIPRVKGKRNVGSYVPKFVTPQNAYMVLSQQSPSVFADGLVTPVPDYLGTGNAGVGGAEGSL